MTKNELTKAEQTALAKSDYGEDTGSGFEGAEEHISIPFLVILQTNSPQCDAQDGIEGAKPGMLFNTVTNELMDHFVFQPVFQEQWYVEWVPRDEGGGFVDRYAKDSLTVKSAMAVHEGKFGKLSLENGNDLVETFYAYGMVLDEKGEIPISIGVIAFKSTQIKPFRNWLTSMFTLLVGPEGDRRKPPIYAHRAMISTVGQRNKKGSFFNFRIEPFAKNWFESLIPADSDLLSKGRDFRKAVKSGDAKPVMEKTDKEEETPDLL